MLDGKELTKREKIILVILVVIGIVYISVPDHIAYEMEIYGLYCFTIPFLIYFLTDPERLKRSKE